LVPGKKQKHPGQNLVMRMDAAKKGLGVQLTPDPVGGGGTKTKS